MSCPAHQLPEAEGSQGGIRSNHRLPLHGIHLDLISCSEFERAPSFHEREFAAEFECAFEGAPVNPAQANLLGGQVHQHAKCCTTLDGIRPTHVQNSAEDYQKTQRTIKLTGKSSHEPGSATWQAGPGPRRRPTTLSETVTLLKENSFSHPPNSQRGRT